MPPERRRDPRWLVPLVTGRPRALLVALSALWALLSLRFWAWWLDPAHVLGWGRFALVSALLLWVQVLGAWYVAFALRAVRPAHPDPVPGRWRVAMVTTKTPSEPFAVVRPTLEAMLAQDHPHDTWLADEDPSPETLAWCAAHGVRVSCRRDAPGYHRAAWPRRARCKEGNLAYFYDRWGYRLYDVVAQLDADHVPAPGYLREMLRPFHDPAVGYVSAPSVCAANAARSWSARARLHAEGPFHGLLQAGYANGWAPLCIGSHYAVRTAALREAGGLGPDLAEDHSTTLLLNAHGWRGAHAIDARATGDGPATLADMATQEFQWSRSLATLLLAVTPPLLGRLPPRLRLQFLFCQVFYPLGALTMGLACLLPPLALVLDLRYADVAWPAFVLQGLPATLAFLLLALAQARLGLLRPADAPILGWERLLFPFLQWPWVAWGGLAALRDHVAGGFVDFRITPKGARRAALPVRVVAVYAALSALCLVPVLLAEVERAAGFYLLSLATGLLYAALAALAVLRHARENGWGAVLARPRAAGFHLGAPAALAVLAALALSTRLEAGVHGLAQGSPYQPVIVLVRASGAGSDRDAPVEYRWALPWD